MELAEGVKSCGMRGDADAWVCFWHSPTFEVHALKPSELSSFQIYLHDWSKASSCTTNLQRVHAPVRIHSFMVCFSEVNKHEHFFIGLNTNVSMSMHNNHA